MNKMNNSKGFTLIETVVSIVLIVILSLGFLQVMTGFLSITAKKTAYDEATNEFAGLIDGKDVSGFIQKDTVLEIGDGSTITLNQYTIDKTGENKGLLRYYTFKSD